jgi:hypothetical protein
MTTYTKPLLTAALKAEDYKAGDVVSELATIVNVMDVKDSYKAGEFKTVGLFIDDSGEFSVFINKLSMSLLIDAYGDENGEITSEQLANKAVTITVINEKLTRNKNAFKVAPYVALRPAELAAQQKLTQAKAENGDDQAEPDDSPLATAKPQVKPSASNQPASQAKPPRTARKPA